MYYERLLAYITGAFVALCLGLGLTMMAMGPGQKAPAVRPADRPASETPAATPAPAPAETAPAPQAAVTPEPAPPPVVETPPRQRVEAAIGAVPEYKTFFARLRDAYPAEYNGALDDFSSNVASGQEPSADVYLSESVRRLRQARGTAAGKAESKPLARVFEMQLEVLKALSGVDKKMCVAFLYGASSLDFQRFAAGRRKLLADMALAGLEAIASGEAKKVARAAPTEADFSALETALAAKGLGKREIDALLDGKTPEPPIDDKIMCAAGQTYFEALRAMPEATRSRIYGLAVELMAKS